MTQRTRHAALHPMAVPGSLRRLVTVGQLSVDQLLVLDAALTVGDQHMARHGQSLGGTAAIVAHNAATLEAPAIQFCGHIGRSTEHRQAVKALQRLGITVGATVTTEIGLRVCIIVEPSGERTMVASGDIPDWSRITLAPTRGDIVFFEGWHLFSEATCDTYAALIETASAAGAVTVLDVCSASRITRASAARLEQLPLDIVLANEAEAETFNLLSGRRRGVAIVHRGTKPTLAIADGYRQTFAVEVVATVDTTGAGDTFTAGLLTALAVGSDLPTAIQCGHRAAAQVVQHVGPLLPTDSVASPRRVVAAV